MATSSGTIDETLRDWLLEQPVFFVATAPLAADQHINCSPKGLPGTFAVLGPTQVAYLDLTGSGIETIAHLQENGRIVIMLCAFAGDPRIVRLHGRGRVVTPGSAEFDGLLGHFSGPPTVRAIIVVDVDRVADSCGFGVPLMDFVAHRSDLGDWLADRGPDGVAEYQARHNVTSIDGLAGLTP